MTCVMLVDSGSDWDLLSFSDWQKLERDCAEGKASIFDLNKNPMKKAKAYGTQTSLNAICPSTRG